MAKYIFKRIIMAIVTIFAVASVTFFVMNMVPGGPFMSEKAISPQAQAALNEKYGLDKPLGEQYVTYMKDLLHGKSWPERKAEGPYREHDHRIEISGVRKSWRHRYFNGSSGGRSIGKYCRL